MNNAELIKDARIIADSIHVHSSFQDWEAAEKDTLEKCAAALETADKRIAELEADKKNLINVVKDKSDFHATKDAMRIAELEAQVPKEGEWIEVYDWLQIPQEERGTYRCSGCGQVMKYPWNYCPNCGMRMRTVTDCHNLGEGER